jgi:membrane-bound serine protease (ClpP class)
MVRSIVVPLLLACSTLCGAPRAVAVAIDGVVHPITVEIVGHALQQARRENADFVLIRLNTPGGLMDAMRQTVEAIVASPVPVITFVTPSGGRAASAGFFILLAGDVAAMATGTNTGAASPVLLAGEMDAIMRKKVENDAAALLRGIAGKRGRNSAVAEQAVLEAKSFSDKEALDNRLIECVARDESDLLRQLDGREIVRFDGRKPDLARADHQRCERPQYRARVARARSPGDLHRVLFAGSDRAGRRWRDHGLVGLVRPLGTAH